MKNELSVFFPVYNDWGTISGMVVSAVDLLEELGFDYEIILVDDGSDRRTKGILNILDGMFDKVRVISHKKNRGYGAALRTGFANSRYDLIFYTDGDAQYDVREMGRLLPLMKDSIDVVNGFKRIRHDPYLRIIIGAIYQHTMRFLFDLPIRDVDCDFRLIRKDVLKGIDLISDCGLICVELIKKLSINGARFTEVSVSHFFRHSGRSQFFKPTRIARTIKRILYLWFSLGHLKNLKNLFRKKTVNE